MALPGSIRVKSAIILAKALQGLVRLQMAVDAAFNTPLVNIAAPNLTLEEAAFIVVTWADERAPDNVLKLVKAARDLNLGSPELAAIEEEIGQALSQPSPVLPHGAGSYPPAPTTSLFERLKPSDPYQALLLGQGLVLVDRSELRKALPRLERDYRIVAVKGAEFCGKSHSIHLVTYVWQHQHTFHLAYTNMADIPASEIVPDILVQNIARQIDLNIATDNIPKTGTDAAWGRALADWLRKRAGESDKPWWLVFDGMDRPNANVPSAVQYMIQELMLLTASRDWNIRIILLGCQEDFPPLTVRSVIKEVKLDKPLTAQDVQDYFQDLFCLKDECETRKKAAANGNCAFQNLLCQKSKCDAAAVKQDVEQVMDYVRDQMQVRCSPNWYTAPEPKNHECLAEVIREVTEAFFF